MTPLRHSPWWCDPVLALCAISLPVVLASYSIPGDVYMAEWGTPKFFDGRYLGYCIACIAAFSIACLGVRSIASRAEPLVRESDWREDVPWDVVLRAFDFTAVLCLFGYAAWTLSAIGRGATLGEALAIFDGSKGAAARMKEVYLVTIPGVTTLTQFGMATIVLGCIAAARFPARRVFPAMGGVMFLAFLRAIFNSERLAMIELAIPGVIIACQIFGERLRHRWWFSPRTLAAGPIVGFLGVFSLFATFEYFRSWSNYYSGGGKDFLSFVAARFTGYYATALNNGAYMTERMSPIDMPFLSVPLIWNFPVLKQIAESFAPNFPLLREDSVNDVLAGGANPEFNNCGGLLLPLIDLGLPGALLYWSIAGLIAGASYYGYRRMRLAGLLTFPILFIGIVEAPRIIYVSDGRVFPTWCAMGAVWMVCAWLAWRNQTVAHHAPKWGLT